MKTRKEIRADLEQILLSSLSMLKNKLVIGDCSIKTQGLLSIAGDSLRMLEKIESDKLSFSDEFVVQNQLDNPQ